MNATVKKKLCWNCEGSAPLTLDNCPYCGVYLNRTAEEEGGIEELTHTPPYQLPIEKEAKEAVAEKEAVLPEIEMGSRKDIFLSSLFLLSGSVFLFFGLLLLLFSRQGVLTLQWEGAYWPLYFSLSIPLLVFGVRFFRKIA